MASNAMKGSARIIVGPEKIQLLDALFFDERKPLYFKMGDDELFAFNLRGMILSEVSPQFATLIITHREQRGGEQRIASVAYDLSNKTGQFINTDMAASGLTSTMGVHCFIKSHDGRTAAETTPSVALA